MTDMNVLFVASVVHEKLLIEMAGLKVDEIIDHLGVCQSIMKIRRA